MSIGFAVLIGWDVLNQSGAAAPALNWKAEAGFRSAGLSVPPNGKPGFTLLPLAQTGVGFGNHLSSATVAKNRLTESGSGVALGDVDGDGWVDIYFCSLEGDNALYRNLGNWTFEDMTPRAGVACADQLSTGCVLEDIDGDGDLDLLVNSLGKGTRLFLNDATGRFSEKKDARLLQILGATSMALADVEGDGDLDLYVTNYRTDTFHDNPPGLRVVTRQLPDGSITVEPAERFAALKTLSGGIEVLERGEPDVFYINLGGGKFAPIRWDIGVFQDEDGRKLDSPPTDWGLSVQFRDLNGDGLPDLYVCNDFVYWPDRVWLNQEGKRFRAIPRQSIRNVSLASMAVDVADINRDGRDDIFVADMLSPSRVSRSWQRPDTLSRTVTWPLSEVSFRPEVPRNTLQLARDDGTFAEIAQFAGLSATDWTWGAAFLDVDLDGWEDLLLATGTLHDVQDTDAMGRIIRSGGWKSFESRMTNLENVPSRRVPGAVLRNRRNGTFENLSSAWGFDAVGIAHGMALADLDNDGDCDVVLNCLNAPARLCRNNTTAPRIAVRLKGAAANTRGIGARIKITGGPVTQTQEMMSGGRYLSGDDALRVFAGGEASALQIEVTWRSGRRTLVTNALPNHVYEILETAAVAPVQTPPEPVEPLFEDLTARLGHAHSSAVFDDFARQPLLPRKLSTLGPGVSWVDVDGDARDDLIIGAGRGGRLEIFRNDPGRGFAKWTGDLPSQVLEHPQTSVLGFHDSDGFPFLVAGQSNREESGSGSGLAPFQMMPLRPTASPAIQPGPIPGGSTTGPLAVADVDSDGDLDVFVGGLTVAGRYPESGASQLLRRTPAGWEVLQTFPRLELVNGAVFTDVDSDGDPDLALACEWDSLRLFENEGGRFKEVTGAYGLGSFKGRWNGITTGDFDGDGRIDLVASNWGRNWRTDGDSENPAPVHLYFGDFSGSGVVQTILASEAPELGKIAPWRERNVLVPAIPEIVERFPDHHSYGRVSVQELLGSRASRARERIASTFDSMMFLNRGGRFEARPLPAEAQFAPAFGISVADFDGDGFDDVFLAQNFFGVDAETSRHDAGFGLLLLGNGAGEFRALGPRESGIAIPGEQRGSAVADFDGDGRMDLVVGQHNGPTVLLRNQNAKAGVRVTLRGPKENPTAIGASVRLEGAAALGPIREIHGGSGFWSQDSARLVFAMPAIPKILKVRWPGGLSRDYPWPDGATEVEVFRESIQPRGN